jgi:hypothetical protein
MSFLSAVPAIVYVQKANCSTRRLQVKWKAPLSIFTSQAVTEVAVI